LKEVYWIVYSDSIRKILSNLESHSLQSLQIGPTLAEDVEYNAAVSRDIMAVLRYVLSGNAFPNIASFDHRHGSLGARLVIKAIGTGDASPFIYDAFYGLEK
jgi:hypothetical protein